MEINFSNLNCAINALRRCSKENKNRNIDTGAICISTLCDDVADFLEKLEKLR